MLCITYFFLLLQILYVIFSLQFKTVELVYIKFIAILLCLCQIFCIICNLVSPSRPTIMHVFKNTLNNYQWTQSNFIPTTYIILIVFALYLNRNYKETAAFNLQLLILFSNLKIAMLFACNFCIPCMITCRCIKLVN